MVFAGCCGDILPYLCTEDPAFSSKSIQRLLQQISWGGYFSCRNFTKNYGNWATSGPTVRVWNCFQNLRFFENKNDVYALKAEPKKKQLLLLLTREFMYDAGSLSSGGDLSVLFPFETFGYTKTSGVHFVPMLSRQIPITNFAEINYFAWKVLLWFCW